MPAFVLTIYGAAVMLCGVVLFVGARIMSALDNLTAAVTQNSTVEASAVTLIQGLADQVKAAAASGDTTQVQALADQITASSAALAQAVAANTLSQGSATAAGTSQQTGTASQGATTSQVSQAAGNTAPAPGATGQ